MRVRQETRDDFDAVRHVHTEAFARSGPAGPVPPEAALTDELRAASAFLPRLSLVAEDDGHIVGHVIATRATVGPQSLPVLGLGPLGVLPARQRQGIGVALMETLIGRVDELGEPMIVLLGDRAYYRRFGFELASTFSVDPPEPSWAPHFQVLPCRAYDPRLRGLFTYAEPFSRL